jgi:hypothetical protein
MRIIIGVASTFCLVALALPSAAEIRFSCTAAEGDECAFSVIHPGGQGTTNFVLKSKEQHGLNDQFAGGRYCVVAGAPGAQVRDWPPKCTNAKNNKPGRIVDDIKAGGSYD